jgi:hypothetical protein
MNLCQRCKKECKHDLEKCTYYSPAKMTNFEKIKAMSIEELSLFLMKVNCAYGVDCMYGMAECKYPNIDNNCSLCFRDWLESEAEDTLTEAINKCNEQLEKHPKFDFSGVKVVK